MLASQSRAGVFVRLSSSILHQRRKHLREREREALKHFTVILEKEGRNEGEEEEEREDLVTTLHLYNHVYSLQIRLKIASIWSVTLT